MSGVNAEEITEEGLPNYYQFFMKEGRLETISAERSRDRQMAAGEIAPVPMETPLPDFTLPDGFGKQYGLRDWVGKKFLVLTTMRTWW